MADITPVDLNTVLTARTFTTAGGSGDKIVQPGGTSRLLLVFKNVNAAARTATITAQETAPDVGGFGRVAVADKVLALAAGDVTPTYGYVEIPKLGFNNAADGNKVAVTYSASGMSLVAFRLPASSP